ncbi:MAG: PglZ domain-containing protein, partial [Bacteroidota bacterium]
KLKTSLNRIHGYKLEEDMLQWMVQRLGTKRFSTLKEDTIKQAVEHLKYNLIMMNVSRLKPEEDTYSHLKLEQTAAINKLHALYQTWKNHPQLSSKIKEVFNKTGQAIDEKKLINIYGMDEDFGYYTDVMYETILQDALDKLKDNPQQIRDEATRWKQHEITNREILNQFQFAYHAGAFYAILNQYSSFCFDTPEEYISRYIHELYKVDYHYRKASIFYHELQEWTSVPGKMQEAFKELSEKYDRYLIDLNVEWQKLLDSRDFDLASIDVDKQHDFFQKNLKDFDSKVAVIISDAFRYETGYELYEKLLTDSKNRVEVNPQMASIPSDTSLGMTNLLPGKNPGIEEKDKNLEYTIDNIPTSSIENRRKIIQKYINDAEVIRLNDLKTYSKEEGRKFFKENRMVYIYHDWIDAIGDNPKTETGAYHAVNTALQEIQSLMRNLYNNWNISHIFITADHGFIYNQGKLKDASRQDYPKADHPLKMHPRFMIGRNFQKVEGYKFPLKNST